MKKDKNVVKLAVCVIGFDQELTLGKIYKILEEDKAYEVIKIEKDNGEIANVSTKCFKNYIHKKNIESEKEDVATAIEKLEKTSISKTYKKVRCTDNIFKTVRLTIGEIYDVIEEVEECYKIKDNCDVKDEFGKWRFEDVEEEQCGKAFLKKVVCIANPYQPTILTTGKIYKVFGEDGKYYNIKTNDDVIRYMCKSFFEDVKKESKKDVEEKEFEEVLKLDYREVWDKVAVKIVYQDESIFARNVFVDKELRVYSKSKFEFNYSGCLFLLGRLEDEIIIVTKEQTERIKHRVLELNKKYGKIKTDEEIIASYPTKEYDKNEENYFLTIHCDGSYIPNLYLSCKVIGAKYYSGATIGKMVKELNNRNKTCGKKN